MINEIRLYYINLLNDFIISKFPKNETSFIKIIDVGNFLIIKGITTNSTPLDMFTIVNEFTEKNNPPKELNFNTIDLIEYSSEDYFNLSDIPILISTRYR